jgi:hypothetical protein
MGTLHGDKWVPKTTNTHSEYVILVPFHCNNGCTNRASMFRYTCIARLVLYQSHAGRRMALRLCCFLTKLRYLDSVIVGMMNLGY